MKAYKIILFQLLVIITVSIFLFISCSKSKDGKDNSPTNEIENNEIATNINIEITSPNSGITINKGDFLLFSSSAFGGTPPYIYNWDFGEGALGSSEQNPGKFFFTDTGDFTITLILTDSLGISCNDTIKIQVLDIENNEPLAEIINPPNDSIYYEGDLISLKGSGGDNEDGPLSGSNLVWSSNHDGIIGTGTTISTSELSVGSHTITLTATDSNGASDIHTIIISIIVIENTLPIASITWPPNGSPSYTQGDPIIFTGAGSDNEDGPLSGNNLVWSSNHDGIIGTGTTISTSELSVGSHTITLTATDSNGASDIHTITISVADDDNDEDDNGETNVITPDLKPYTNSLNMTFNLMPAGVFMMGSPSNEIGRDSDETQHQVTLTQSFYIQTTEVTQDQWEKVMGNNPSYFSSCGGDCPVDNVSWDDVQEFIGELNKLGQGIYRLPTEAEWEYACRGGGKTAFANGKITNRSGDDPNLDKIGWYYGNSWQTIYPDGTKTDFIIHPVGQKQPNAWGIYDMHGNVYEWCSDWYEEYPTEAVTDPLVSLKGRYEVRVLRGGFYSTAPRHCRSAGRYYYNPNGSIGDRFGFRLVKIP